MNRGNNKQLKMRQYQLTQRFLKHLVPRLEVNEPWWSTPTILEDEPTQRLNISTNINIVVFRPLLPPALSPSPPAMSPPALSPLAMSPRALSPPALSTTTIEQPGPSKHTPIPLTDADMKAILNRKPQNFDAAKRKFPKNKVECNKKCGAILNIGEQGEHNEHCPKQIEFETNLKEIRENVQPIPQNQVDANNYIDQGLENGSNMIFQTALGHYKSSKNDPLRFLVRPADTKILPPRTKPRNNPPDSEDKHSK